MSKTVPDSVTRLIESFARLPGIGPKTASRLTYFLLRAQDDVSDNLSDAIHELKRKTRLCPICFNITETTPCPVCADANRDGHLIVVVEEPLDALAIERTGIFKGRYHVLHGAISPMDGIGPEQLRIKELAARINGGGVEEVILATNPRRRSTFSSTSSRQTRRCAGLVWRAACRRAATSNMSIRSR
jgi:recombination protein RecR